MAKSRVTPIKFVSIPRQELVAGALSIKGSVMLQKELTIHSNIKKYFWPDSQVVLNYINSNSKRLKIYMAKEFSLSKKTQMLIRMYTESKLNLADDTSCSLSTSNHEKVKC